jgi:hypothetical protein
MPKLLRFTCILFDQEILLSANHAERISYREKIGASRPDGTLWNSVLGDPYGTQIPCANTLLSLYNLELSVRSYPKTILRAIWIVWDTMRRSGIGRRRWNSCVLRNIMIVGCSGE